MKRSDTSSGLRSVLPDSLRQSLHSIFRRLPGGTLLLRRFSSRDPDPDCFLISFPKCGRTWLRLLIGKYLQSHFDLPDRDLIELDRPHPGRPEIPRIRVTHDDYPAYSAPSELKSDKSSYRHQKVILLVRDPRDVMISLYFQRTKRERDYKGDLSGFLRDEAGSLETLIRWYNIWAENSTLPGSFLLVQYEKLHENTKGELKQILQFLGLPAISDASLDEAVSFAAFDNMRRLEADRALGSRKLAPGDPLDPESFKTRRGVVGGYKDYLSAADTRFVDDLIAEQLSETFDFYREAWRSADGGATGQRGT